MEKSPQYLASRRLLVTISITVFVELGSTKVEVRSVEFLRMLIIQRVVFMYVCKLYVHTWMRVLTKVLMIVSCGW